MTDRSGWKGQWIWPDRHAAGGNEAVLFRRSFTRPSGAAGMRIRVSADSRYRLFVNGASVGVGPCKGDRYTHYYETFDLDAEQLIEGVNTIAARVVHYDIGGPRDAGGPSAVWRSPQGGFILDAELFDQDGQPLLGIWTDPSWRCLRDPSWTLENESWMSGVWMGGVERTDGLYRPHGWEHPEYDDAQWQPPVIIAGTVDPFGILNEWPLTPRTIPHLYESERSFSRAVRSEGWTSPGPLADDAVIEAGSRAWIELDCAELTTGYLSLAVTGGAGSRIRLLPAECYETTAADGSRLKQVRDETLEGGVLAGDSDLYVVAGVGTDDRPELYEPFWFRTFRFVRLEVETAGEPLGIRRFTYRETGYPLDVKTSFACSDPSCEPLWAISLRTLRRCMHETYEDCPYYEQMQYAMDTALQMLFTYNVSGDDRLARKAIRDFQASRLPDGMLQSRYPTVEPQVIPGFSLYWIFMVHDHYRCFGDLPFVRSCLPTADGVIEWFRARLDSNGMIGRSPAAYWPYVDWVDGWRDGVPPAAADGPLAVDSLMFAAALNRAAVLHEELGRGDMAAEYRALAAETNAAVHARCWSEEDRLYRDGPTVRTYSQHAQLWSVLSGLTSGAEAAALMRRTMTADGIARASYSMAFFLFRALERADVYDLAWPLWGQWHDMVRLGLTTWAEDPTANRSDCHAWGAAPLYEFPSVVLGVKPAAPGYARIAVEPKPGPLTWAEGSIATPRGLVCVRWEREGEAFRIAVDGPADTPLSIRLPDGTVHEYAGAAAVRAAGRAAGYSGSD